MGLQRMTMQNAVNREFLNIQIQRGQILGNARIVVATESYVRKYFFNAKMFPEIKKGSEMMKAFHPDLFVDFYEGEYICVTMNNIDSLGKREKIDNNITGNYRSNIKNYLQLYSFFGDKMSKRDLTPSNMLYRKSDLKFFIIDWDNVQYFESKEKCYKFYEDQLCDYRWEKWFNLDRHQMVKIFQEEWKLIAS